MDQLLTSAATNIVLLCGVLLLSVIAMAMLSLIFDWWCKTFARGKLFFRYLLWRNEFEKYLKTTVDNRDSYYN